MFEVSDLARSLIPSILHKMKHYLSWSEAMMYSVHRQSAVFFARLSWSFAPRRSLLTVHCPYHFILWLTPLPILKYNFLRLAQSGIKVFIRVYLCSSVVRI